MKLLVVSPPATSRGGVATFADLLCATLAARHAVFRARAGAGIDTGKWVPFRVLRDAWTIRRVAIAEAVDAVVLNPSFNKAILRDLLNLLVLRTAFRGTVMVVNHGWGTSMPTTIDRHRTLQRLARMCFGSVDRILVLGHARRALLLRWGFGSDQVKAASMMYDPLAVGHDKAPAGRRASHLQVLMLSRLAPGKGAEELLDAVAALGSDFADVRWVIAGDGPQRASLQQRAQDLGLSSRVSFPGFIEGPAKARCLEQADLFVLPSHLNEGFPVSLLEAMGAGLPIVASAVGGVLDLFEAGASGQALPPRPQPPQIADALRRMLADRAGLATAGEANRRLALARFAAKVWCEAFEHDLRQCIAARAGQHVDVDVAAR